MMSKRTLLALSVALSVILHGLLLAVAPRVDVLTARAAPPDLFRTFKVQVVEDTRPPVDTTPGAEGTPLVTRPGTVRDLLEQESQRLAPDESLLEQIVDIEELAQRASAEEVEREHELEPDESVLAKVDAKIIEISESTARQDIQVARRLVAPSSNRILGEDEFPLLRGTPDETEEVLVLKPLPARRVGSGGGGAEPAPALLEKPEEPSGPAEPAEKKAAQPLGEPPLEKLAVRSRVAAEVRKDTDYEFMDDLLDVHLESYLPPGQGEGFFRLRIVPKEGEDIPPLPKDVTFIVDASRSIMPRKLERTAAGVRSCIEGLRLEDRFNVVVFRDSATPFRPGLVEATPENKAAAAAFLDELESRGETDVYTAIKPVVLSEFRAGIPNVVMLMTDGKPTTGIRDARTIINALTQDNALRKSIFAFGGGRTVDRYMLDLLAYRNKGESHVAPVLEDIDEELAGFFGKLQDPLLVDCQADYGWVAEENVFPKQLPDFYKGRAVTVYGRFDPEKQREFAMRLTGLAGDRKKEVVFKADLREAATGNSDIAHDWAFRKVYFLIGETCRVGETPELMDQLRALTREYDIRTAGYDG
ncbi:MAG: VWA domain-containing protein [Candidatus Hydrogenedentes bacterium]|nr:VWA domain-containing protein [Candidatus Hydrogenedentota bacterium]